MLHKRPTGENMINYVNISNKTFSAYSGVGCGAVNPKSTEVLLLTVFNPKRERLIKRRINNSASEWESKKRIFINDLGFILRGEYCCS